MLKFYEIVAFIMAVFSIVLFVLFIRSLLKNESAKILSFELGGCLAFATFCIVVMIPGSESNFELGPIKYRVKTPSEIAKLVGAKDKTFEALNTDVKNPKSLIFSASSTSPNVTPDLKFFEGKEYIKMIDQSKDGRERIFSATLPPGKEIKAASPEQVIINIIPDSLMSKIVEFRIFPAGDESKAIKEYYKLENTK